jgi:serine/threonine-protein kinase
VYRVWHEHLGLQALKLFKQMASPSEIDKMLEEARLLSTLGHANIVRVFDAGMVQTREGLRGYFTMEYIADGNLERLATAHHPSVPTELVTEVMEQIASGLAVAHCQDPPIVHRDITLANLLVGYDGAGLRLRIGDFGLAKQADPFTLMASARGTYAFMAPEVRRSDGYSCASDVWSVGTIVYWLLTNHFPFDDGDQFSSYSIARFNRPLLAPSRYNDDVDDELDRIVLTALEIDPRNRFGTARLLADALLARRRKLAPGPLDTAQISIIATTSPTESAQSHVEEALLWSRMPGRLSYAADLLEEAINSSPQLWKKHADRLMLWRRGVVL